MKQMRDEGLDTLDKIIAKYPGVNMMIDLRILDDPRLPQEDKEFIKRLIADGDAEVQTGVSLANLAKK